jgi:biopolymer transport protein ExbD
MKRLALIIVAAVALSGAVVPPQSRAAAPDCRVTIHVSNAGAFSLSNCKSARRTTEETFPDDVRAMMAQGGGDASLVIFDAAPEASLYATATAMNRVQDTGVYEFEIVDEPGRPSFRISMPAVSQTMAPQIIPRTGDAAKDREIMASAPRPKRPGYIRVNVRPDHLLDVLSTAGPPLRVEGRFLATRDPENPRVFIASAIKLEDLPLLMPQPDPYGMAVAHGLGARWAELRAIYRVFAAAGFGRLISEDAHFM